VQNTITPLSDRLTDLESSLSKFNTKLSTQDSQHKESTNALKEALGRDLEDAASKLKAELDSLRGHFKVLREASELYQT
jgi:seryl-tRNA synthetase